jgi:DNA-binding beta-propeller fold protein YncE
VAVSVSPDGRTLAILTSGFNRNWGPGRAFADFVPELSTEYVFLFDVSRPRPKRLQVIPIPNSFQGLAWSRASDRLFVAGGKDDDVLEFVRSGAAFVAGRTIKLGHKAGVGVSVSPIAGALAVSPDGHRLLVANFNNDSVSLVDLARGEVIAEQDLRPGIIDPARRGQPGGSFPRCAVWVSDTHAYVGSERDREIVSLAVDGGKIEVVKRIAVHGQPTALIANSDGSRLYAALDNTDQVVIFDTARDAEIESVAAAVPPGLYANEKKLGGANSNALALAPDGRNLLVSNGGENAIAVIRLSEAARGANPQARRTDDDNRAQASSAVVGLVPTGWYPTGVATSRDGATWYVVNAKSPTGPTTLRACDPTRERLMGTGPTGKPSACLSQNQYIGQLEKAGFLAIPSPAPLELARLTKQVARNDGFDHQEARDEKLFSFLRAHIHHIIYIIKENRSYDQVLGDLEIGNGDPRLTLFPERNSPNHHALARNFVTLDNFLVSGEVSWTGWDWAVSAQTNDFREREEPLAMAQRGLDGDPTGFNRNINIGLATAAERHAARAVYPTDPDVVPGEGDVTAPDGPGGEEGKGTLWDEALRRGRTLRNWGFWGENRQYPQLDTPLVREPFAAKQQVFFSMKSSLTPYSDPYFLDFSPANPDFWRVHEWKREFTEFSAKGEAPELMLVRIGNDHFGAFAYAIDGVDTPETQMADNDYGLGLIVEAVADSPFAKDTLIISIEDDACDGPDHVDTHRSIALFAGPYVRQHALVTTRYTTVNIVKTIEDILGIGPIGLNDALAAPMAAVFDTTAAHWAYKAVVPDVLRTTKLPLPPQDHACNAAPRHAGAYWAKLMASQDFSGADRIDAASFNRALWLGLKGDAPYPAAATGADLRMNRALGKASGDGC